MSIDDLLMELVHKGSMTLRGKTISPGWVKEAKAQLLALVRGEKPKNLSLDNLDPKEKIDRVEFARLCNVYNRGIDAYEANLIKLFKEVGDE